jgi:DNA-binding MarR family transcriptional regulator
MKPCDRKDSPLDIPLAGHISIIMRNRTIFFNREVSPLNITAAQIPYLMVLSLRQGITQDELSGKLFIDKGTVARSMKKLEDNGFIYRVPDPDNRRKNHVFLTEKGERILPRIRSIDRKWEEALCEGLIKAERSQLFDSIGKLAKNSIENLTSEGDQNE